MELDVTALQLLTETESESQVNLYPCAPGSCLPPLVTGGHCYPPHVTGAN
jgi:hypothetical protein